MSDKTIFKERRKLTTSAKIWRESVGMSVAEIASGITTLGVVAVADKIAPDMVKHVSKFLAKHIFEPYLDFSENVLKCVCRLKDCQPDPTKSREERAENLARATVLFAPAFASALLVKLMLRKKINQWTRVDDKVPNGETFKLDDTSVPYKSKAKWYTPWKYWSKKDWMITAMDEGVHLGAIAMLNVGVPEVGDSLLASTKNILKAAGVSDRKATDAANTLIVWELPNIVGLAAGIGGIYGHHTYGWMHRDRIKGSGLFEKITSR